jgi:hypothetical protein
MAAAGDSDTAGKAPLRWGLFLRADAGSFIGPHYPGFRLIYSPRWGV